MATSENSWGRCQRFAVFIGIAVLSFCAALESKSVSADTLIVYGGVGHVKGLWQPETQKILTAKSGRPASMRRALGVALENQVKVIQFDWSASKVAITSDDVAAAIRKRDPSWGNRIPSMKDIAGHFDSVYALVVVPTLEARFVAEGGSSDIAVDNEIFQVWTTAVLVELGTGEVKLAATASRDVVHSADGGKSAVDDITAKFYSLIEQSSFEAIERLSGLSKDKRPADEFPMMFTGAIVKDPFARKLFQFGAEQKLKRKNVCKMPSECEHANCGRLIALLANGVAEKLTSRNVPVLPAINLNAWGQRAEDRVAMSLTLPRGAAHFEEKLSIAVGADSADKKLVPIVSTLRFADVNSNSRHLRQRSYGAKTRVVGFETNADDCAKLESAPVPTDPSAAGFRVPVVKGAPAQTELHRARLLMALYKSISKVDFDVLK